MNRERAKELLPVIEAYSKGGTVQFRDDDSPWRDWGDPDFTSRHGQYRIKPEPHDIKWAAEQMKAGKSVRRSSWGNEGYRIAPTGIIQVSHLPDGRPHQMTHIDILADDWEIYEPK